MTKIFLTRPFDLQIKQRSNLLFISSGSMLKVNVIVKKKTVNTAKPVLSVHSKIDKIGLKDNW